MSKIKINSVNDTKGAQVGAIKAMVIDSLTPMTSPAIKGAQAEANLPIMTTAKITPIQAKICDGARVNVKATQTPAQQAKAAHAPDKARDNLEALMPKARAMSGSSALALKALPMSVL